jgi:virulence factor
MLKVGIIGLGDIALKAYLPVMSIKEEVEIHLFARDESHLKAIGKQYRFKHLHPSLDGLINAGIKAAFVHTSTASHYEVVQTLLENNVHVYVDKPVTYDLASTEKLISLADKKGMTLMAGFNRRYAPAYVSARQMKDINMVLMQKNRKSLRADVRTFIFDDFIHVVDTLLFLLPSLVERITVRGRKVENQLAHVMIELSSTEGTTAVGIMNRDSGTVEERLEVFTPAEKMVVTNLAETTVLRDREQIKKSLDDWQRTLHRRGFVQITDLFLDHVSKSQSPKKLHQDILLTHQYCEQIVRELL